MDKKKNRYLLLSASLNRKKGKLYLTPELGPFQVFDLNARKPFEFLSVFLLSAFFSVFLTAAFLFLFFSNDLTRRKAKSWSEASRNGIKTRSPSGNSATVSPVFSFCTLLHDFGQAPDKSQQAPPPSDLTRRKVKSWSEASRNGIKTRSPSGNSATVNPIFLLHIAS